MTTTTKKPYRPPAVQSIKKCSACGHLVQAGNGLRNAHTVVCSWRCADAWNQTKNVNYAWRKCS